VRTSQFSLTKARGSSDSRHVTFAIDSAGLSLRFNDPRFPGHPPRTYAAQDFCASPHNSSTCRAVDGAAEMQLKITVSRHKFIHVSEEIIASIFRIETGQASDELRQPNIAVVPTAHRCHTLHVLRSPNSVRPNADALYFYSTDVQFESRQRRLSWLEYSVVLLSPSRHNISIIPRELPSKSFTIHQSSYHLSVCKLNSVALVREIYQPSDRRD
jgi:hypothetical protein